MKKTYIALAVLAMAALAGCQTNEIENDVYIPEDGEIVFRIGGNSRATKASDIGTSVRGMTFEMGNGFYLSETVTDLEAIDYGPETKGTPGYTENFHPLYGGFNATVFREGETTAYEEDGRFTVVDEETHLYKRKYPNDLWEKKGLHFFLNAFYENGSMAGVSSLTPHVTTTAATGTEPAYKVGDISFNFNNSTLGTAEAQSDLLFTYRPVSDETEYQKLISKSNGINVLFHHALTGVKFRVGNDNRSTTKTIITKVEISGLYDKGLCVITPDPENNYQDEKEVYSSSSAVKWYNHDMVLGTFSQEFSNPPYVVDTENPENNKNNPDGTVGTTDYQGSENYKFGDSWYSAASENNLNNADGSWTFWFIPQSFKNADNTARNVTLKVTFRVKTPDTPDGTEITHTISDFGSKLAAAGVEWKAGELRTYTLEPRDVDVDIFDNMTGYVKNNLHVTNTGNVDEYVRMMLMGNWYGWLPDQDPATDQPSMLVGYTSADTSDETMVTNWFGRALPFSNGFDSTFAGGKPAGNNPWVFGTGSYYYYPEVIGAGEKLSQTAALFQSYTLDPTWVPDIYIPVGGVRKPAKGVHLVFECVVQAISAKDANGNPYPGGWKEAWSAATGYTIEEKN